MRQLYGFFAEDKEEAGIRVCQETYYDVLMHLRTEKSVSTAEIKTDHLGDLLIETLDQWVHCFDKSSDCIAHSGDKKTLEDFTAQLDSSSLLPDIVHMLAMNGYRLKPGWTSGGFVYAVFTTVLARLCFQSQRLWRSKANYVAQLEAEVDTVEKAVKLLKGFAQRWVEASNYPDRLTRQRAKNVFLMDAAKAPSKTAMGRPRKKLSALSKEERSVESDYSVSSSVSIKIKR